MGGPTPRVVSRLVGWLLWKTDTGSDTWAAETKQSRTTVCKAVLLGSGLVTALATRSNAHAVQALSSLRQVSILSLPRPQRHVRVHVSGLLLRVAVFLDAVGGEAEFGRVVGRCILVDCCFCCSGPPRDILA